MGLLIAALAVGVLAPLSAVTTSEGALRIRRETRPLATISFQAASAGWHFATTVPSKDGTLTAKLGDASIAVKTSAVEEKDGVRYTIEATPDSDAKIESAHLSVALPSSWIGGTAMFDLLPVGIPNVEGGALVFKGKAARIDLRQGSDHVVLELPQESTAMLQDSRRSGVGFDLRIGSPQDAETWSKGATRRFSVLVRSDSRLQLFRKAPYTIQAGPEWIPLDFQLDVTPGSALDWTPRSVQPAGAHGRVIVSRDGRFVYEDSVTDGRRFYGANLVFTAAMPNHDTAEKLAERLMRLGYNAIRLHHFDRALTGGDAGTTSTQLAADPLDRMDFLIAALKKRGIYTTLDLYTDRALRHGELGFDALSIDDYKALLLVDERARNNWWDFTRALLEHQNPYTNLAWKDDPAIAWLSVVNENTLGSTLRSANPLVKALVNDIWHRDGHTGDWTYESNEGARFAAKLHADAYQWMKGKIRSIGCKALLTDVNGWHDQTALILHRNELDYVDDHDYWDHPQFLGDAWRLPSRGSSGGGMATTEMGGGLQTTTLARIAGKPFAVSEFNFVAPNSYRAEAGLLMGSIAARQDWDALWRFAWSHTDASLKAPSPIDYFDVASDPIALATERAIVALFLHRDMQPALNEAYVNLSGQHAGAANYASPLTADLFDVRIGSTLDGSRPGENPSARRAAELRPVSIDAFNGILTVNTARTAGLFAPIGLDVKAGPLSATLTGSRANLWASSLDGQPLRISDRILLTHITDAQNTGVQFASEDREVLNDWGHLPHLVRSGGASIDLDVQRPERVKVFRLDMAGNRIERLPTKVTLHGIHFDLEVSGPKGATLYYEVVRQTVD